MADPWAPLGATPKTPKAPSAPKAAVPDAPSTPTTPAPPPAWVPPTAPIAATPVPVMPGTVNYPTPVQQTALNQLGMSGVWGNWFSQLFGPLANFYTPARGGTAQATADYRSWSNLFADAAGRPATDADISRVFGEYQHWVVANQQVPTLAGLLDFTRTLIGRPAQPAPVVYSRFGNIV